MVTLAALLLRRDAESGVLPLLPVALLYDCSAAASKPASSPARTSAAASVASKKSSSCRSHGTREVDVDDAALES